MSDWLSVCCSADPHYMFEMSGDAYIGIIGICSNCKDHSGFKEYEYEESKEND